MAATVVPSTHPTPVTTPPPFPKEVLRVLDASDREALAAHLGVTPDKVRKAIERVGHRVSTITAELAR